MNLFLSSAGGAALAAVVVAISSSSSQGEDSIDTQARPPDLRSFEFVHVEIPVQPLANYALVADAIVLARVDAWHEEYPEDRIAETVYSATVLERWKGEPSESVEIRVAGAEYGERVVRVPSSPRFDVGEHVVLFLSRDPASEAYWILGLGGGTYRLGGDRTPSVRGLHARGIDLAAFETEVRDLVRSTTVPVGK